MRVDVYPTAEGTPVKDLRADDFEIFEDDVPHKIATFKYVEVARGGPDETRREPASQRESNQMAADPRARVFVIFLDTYHVTVDSSHRMQGPLIELLDRVIGQDDLVGIMTPEMSAANLVLARRTASLGEMLKTSWYWGRRDQLADQDPKEQFYDLCFPRAKAIVDEMIARRREKLALDAMTDLVMHLQGVRDERKAILVVSEGWRLFRPDQNLARPLDNQVPGTPEVYVGRNGRLGTTDERNVVGGGSRYECETDRLNLSMQHTERDFLDLISDANRANASFYPIDPRGLPVFDEPVRADRQPLPPDVDMARLRVRQESLRTIAGATDGMAIVNQNDIAVALKRVIADLTSYYLLGYYSTNTKLDGKFRSIKVRVKRPGVDVRARRGYRAPTTEEVAASRTVSAEKAAATPSAVSSAVADLSRIRPQARFRIHAVPVWFQQPHDEDARAALRPVRPELVEGRTAGSAQAAGAASVGIRDVAIRLVGELDFAAARSAEWQQGGQVEIAIADSVGRAIATAKTTIAPGARHFVTDVAPGAPLDGTYTVTVRVRPAGAPGLPVADAARVTVPAISSAGTVVVGQPMVLRRGPTTGTRYEPTADLRFRRSDRVRLDIPLVGDAAALGGRLLDRNGHPMAVPVAVTTRQDADGARWVTAEVAAAALGAGDYGVEVTIGGATGAKLIVAFRVIP